MHMQFTSEEAGDDGSTPFLDILITPDKAGNLTTTLYRKPIHMDLYLQWDSNHTVASKYSVVDSLQHRANTISSNADLLKTAQKHLQVAVERCKYLAWAMNTANMKTRSATNKSRTRNSNASSNIQKPHMVIPYYQGMSDSLQKTWRAYGVQVYFQGGHTIKNVLMAPKDQDAIHNKSGIIYIYHCDRVECDEEYIAESSRTFDERFKEYLETPCPIYDHYHTTGQNVALDNFTIVRREDQNLCIWITGALYIRVHNLYLNQNIGKYHLLHIWDEVLHDTSELKLKSYYPAIYPPGNNINKGSSHPALPIPSTTGQQQQQHTHTNTVAFPSATWQQHLP